jgi:hypothetical protein
VGIAVGLIEGLNDGRLVIVTVGEKEGVMVGDTDGFEGAIVGQSEGLEDEGK